MAEAVCATRYRCRNSARLLRRHIPDKEVRELLGVVPEDALNELVEGIARARADRVACLVPRFKRRSQPSALRREAIRHMRNLVDCAVCGADSDLSAGDSRSAAALAKAAAIFSEEDLTRFFNILRRRDDDLRA